MYNVNDVWCGCGPKRVTVDFFFVSQAGGRRTKLSQLQLAMDVADDQDELQIDRKVLIRGKYSGVCIDFIMKFFDHKMYC